jgi:hypothetical protein
VARSVSPTGVGGLDTGSKQISKHVDKNACRGVVKTRVLTHVSSCVNTCLSGQSPPRSCIVKPLNPTPPPTSNWVIRGQVCVCAELVVLRVCWAQNRYPKRCHGSATVTRANSTFAEVMVSISVRSLYTIPEHCLVHRTARQLQVSRDHCIHTSHTFRPAPRFSSPSSHPPISHPKAVPQLAHTPHKRGEKSGHHRKDDSGP